MSTHQFSEPSIRRLPTGWYIEFFTLDVKTGKRLKQNRETHNLNRVASLADREIQAQLALNTVRHRLGFKTTTIHNYPNTPILTALDKALLIKSTISSRKKSEQVYTNAYKSFKKYLSKEKIDNIPISAFTKTMALGYQDFLRTSKSATGKPFLPKTINNYVLFIGAFFYELLNREYITFNPFKDIKRIKENDPIKRAFDDAEKEVIMPEIRKDPVLFLAQTLLYRCAIRPIEITRLKPRYFDWKNGLIKIPGSETKQNRGVRIINIADEILPFLKDKIEHIKAEWYIFGEGFEPHATKMCGCNSFNRRHRKILLRLQKSGKLDSIEGLCFYSWKDTSAFNHIDAGLDMRSLQELFGHSDLNTTQKYFKRKGMINEKIKKVSLGFEE